MFIEETEFNDLARRVRALEQRKEVQGNEDQNKELMGECFMAFNLLSVECAGFMEKHSNYIKELEDGFKGGFIENPTYGESIEERLKKAYIQKEKYDKAVEGMSQALHNMDTVVEFCV